MTLAVLAEQLSRFDDRLNDAVMPKAGPMLRRVVLTRAPTRMMDAAVDAKVRTSGDTLSVFPTPAGAWTVLESGSRKRQWWEPARVTPRSRRIKIGGDVRVRVLHGPIRGRRMWTAAKTEMADRWFDLARTEARRLWGSVDGT